MTVDQQPQIVLRYAPSKLQTEDKHSRSLDGWFLQLRRCNGDQSRGIDVEPMEECGTVKEIHDSPHKHVVTAIQALQPHHSAHPSGHVALSPGFKGRMKFSNSTLEARP